ncbi:MAG: tRNA-dihydrouridine synthase family protein [Akkermansia sp.]|nr:tRNA-dihydrouridine synthase family protein [Akkermansia sp.]
MQLALAPMQDVTDLAFMRTLARIGSLPDVFLTAYFRSTPTTCALAEQNLRCLTENETGVPVIAQLAGSDAEALVRDARYLQTLPGAGINLNAGCPSPLVNRHGAGAGLLRELDRFRGVACALREAVPDGQYSIKTRLGWAEKEEFDRVLEVIAAARPDSVMVHARTRKELYGGHPHAEAWAQAVRRLSCPVWLNGDIITAAQARAALVQSGAAGVMIGRGAVRNPYIFRELHGGHPATEEDLRRYYGILIEETGRIFGERRTDKGHCNRMKKYLAFCYPDFTAEQEYHLRRCTDVGEMGRLLEL